MLSGDYNYLTCQDGEWDGPMEISCVSQGWSFLRLIPSLQSLTHWLNMSVQQINAREIWICGDVLVIICTFCPAIKKVFERHNFKLIVFIQIYLFSLDLLQFLVKHFVFVFNNKNVMNNINYPCRHHLL